MNECLKSVIDKIRKIEFSILTEKDGCLAL